MRMLGRWRSRRGAEVLLLVFTLALVLAVFRTPEGSQYLTWDDDHLVLRNVFLQKPFWEAWKGIWTSLFEGDYLPIAFLSYWLEIKLWGLSPGAHHATNLLLHACNVGLMWAWLDGLRLRRALRWFAVWAFAFHPLQVESVMWISERKGLLCAFFLLIALLCHQRSRRPGSKPGWQVAYWLAFVLSCLSKATGVFVPFALALWDGWEQGRAGARWAWRHLPALAAAAAMCVLRFVAYAASIPALGAATLEVRRWGAVPEVVVTALGHYWSTFLMPWSLAPIYPDFPQTEHRHLKLALGIAMSALWLWKARRRVAGTLRFFGLWSFALLLPVVQVVPRINFVNDRYMYLPIAGFAIVIGSLLSELAPGALRLARARPSLLLAAAPLWAALASDQGALWRDSLSLWKYTAEIRPSSHIAWSNYAIAQLDSGDPIGAERSLLRCVSDPQGTIPLAYINLGYIYSNPAWKSLPSGASLYRPELAVKYLKQGAELARSKEDYFVAQVNLASIEVQAGRIEEGRRILKSLLEVVKASRENGIYRMYEREIQADLERFPKETPASSGRGLSSPEKVR